jgi:DNA-binding IclR family transcriptional regulator
LTAELAEARAELTAVARSGRMEGASIRAIAEAVGLSRPRVHELLSDTTRPLQAVESMDEGPTCG